MLALSIRQPYIEQILRGVKVIEYRSVPTRRIGERFYLYASTIPGPCAEFAALGCEAGDLPVGRILGSAKISHVSRGSTHFHWHLVEVRRLKRPLKPRGRPQPIWFNPFPSQ